MGSGVDSTRWGSPCGTGRAGPLGEADFGLGLDRGAGSLCRKGDTRPRGPLRPAWAGGRSGGGVMCCGWSQGGA